MTEIDLLKRVRADEPAADPLVLARARERLLTPAPVRRRPTRLLVAAGVAVTLTGAFLAKDVVSHDGAPVPGTVADAGTVLADAAAKSQATPETPVPPGQFHHVTTYRTYAHSFGAKKQYRATSRMLVDSWIPTDPTSRYLERVQLRDKVEFATAEAEAAAPRLAPYLLRRPAPYFQLVTCHGIPVQPALSKKVLNAPCTPNWARPTAEFLARQPRDPNALLAVLRKSTPPAGRPEHALDRARAAETPPDFRAFTRISGVLESGSVPPDLRAALYRAARKIPGLQLLGTVETLDGRRGEAIAYFHNTQRHDLIIDPSTGQSIGSRLIDSQLGVPPDNVYSAVSFTSRVTATQPVR